MKCLATLALLLSVFSWAESQIAQTEYGLVQGQTRTTETGQVYHSFESIPYARQPIGVLRFRVRNLFGCGFWPTRDPHSSDFLIQIFSVL